MEIIDEPGGGYTEALGSHAQNPPEPKTTGDKLFALNQWWTVSSCEGGIKAQFEGWVREGTKQLIAELAKSDPLEAAAHREIYQTDFSAREYSWDGRKVFNARFSVSGALYLFYLLLNRCHLGITEEKAKEIAKDNPVGVRDAIMWAQGLSGNLQAPQEGASVIKKLA